MSHEQKVGEAIGFLSEWYYAQCDDDWEHGFGIKLGTIDNPGFTIDVDLLETNLENVDFEDKKINYEDELNWIVIRKRDKQLQGRCGPLMLSMMLIEIAGAIKEMESKLR